MGPLKISMLSAIVAGASLFAAAGPADAQLYFGWPLGSGGGYFGEPLYNYGYNYPYPEAYYGYGYSNLPYYNYYGPPLYPPTYPYPYTPYRTSLYYDAPGLNYGRVWGWYY